MAEFWQGKNEIKVGGGVVIERFLCIGGSINKNKKFLINNIAKAKMW